MSYWPLQAVTLPFPSITSELIFVPLENTATRPCIRPPIATEIALCYSKGSHLSSFSLILDKGTDLPWPGLLLSTDEVLGCASEMMH